MAAHQAARPLHQSGLLRRRRQIVIGTEHARGTMVMVGQFPSLLGWLTQWARTAARNRPHFRSGKRVNLLNRAVGQLPVVRVVVHFTGSMNSRPPR